MAYPENSKLTSGKNVSKQPVMKAKNRPGAYWEKVRDKLETTKAAQVLNRSINGEDIDPVRLKVCMYVVDKTLPNLQAVAMDVRSTQVNTIQDVETKLLLSGIQPADAWRLLLQPPTDPEKIIEGETFSERGTPRQDDA